MEYSIIKELHGKVCSKVEVVEYLEASRNQAVLFHLAEGGIVALSHDQCCCEDVLVEDIVGELSDLVEHPLYEAEVASCGPSEPTGEYDSETWTYYKFGTAKGCVSIRWVGSSNGYYSESVDVFVFGGNPSEERES
jgi:hypothetical protein